MRHRPLSRLVSTAVVAAAMAGVGLVAASATGGVAQAAPKAKPYYISMGDSYSVGYQDPTLGNTPGFTAYVAKKEKMQLENFGCGGATTTSMFTQDGCPSGASAATDGVAYPTTDQVAAVVAFIDANPGKVGLVTVSIGGNDVTACAGAASPIACVAAANTTIETNVTNLVDDVSAALDANGDSSAPLVGTTYPDVILGDYVYPTGATDPVLAAQSVVAFDDLINPTLDTAYTSVAQGAFVDVTDAPYKLATAGDETGSFNTTTGAYTGPTTSLRPFGRDVPVAVDEVCKLTYYCSITGDIHANTKGYDFIGGLIVAKLASLSAG
ncbi:MAG: SGNH/GDSL hydrolase family protein [Acidimicrobiales bacterium]|jgi:lysophospholipase L1-like esterase